MQGGITVGGFRDSGRKTDGRSFLFHRDRNGEGQVGEGSFQSAGSLNGWIGRMKDLKGRAGYFFQPIVVERVSPDQ